MFVLIGNYRPDKQESMERFSLMLSKGFEKAGHGCEIWRPNVFFAAKSKSTYNGLGKWLGYIDKWILFPFILKSRLRHKKYKAADIRFHICDHSNAYYLKFLPEYRTGITCHDVLAIRGAMGYADAYCPSSGMGKILQAHILKNLSKARLLAAVSQFTLSQLQELAQSSPGGQKKWVVIHNAFNADFGPMEKSKALNLLAKVGMPANQPYLLHTGSDLLRKNRKLLLGMVAALGSQWDGLICYAGNAVDDELLNHAISLNLKDRILSVVKPNHEELVALYSSCSAFVFPSYSEGFGWPLIEAQACMAPVIASNIAPFLEVCGGAALHAGPDKPADFAAAFLQLKDDNLKANLIRQGVENCRRFSPDKIIKLYLELHEVN